MVKNYNKILEAVNRGIKFALDDYEDDEFHGQDNSKVKNNSNLKEYFEWEQLINKFKNQNINKKDLSRIVELYKLLNLKYTVNTKDELQDIIQYICNINDKIDLNWIDTSHLEDMSNLFEYSSFNGNISKWVVSNVKKMNFMFAYCKFNGNISKWDVSNVENMFAMFFNNDKFNKPLNNWNIQSVKNLSAMFHSSVFNKPLNNWDVSNVTDMNRMFQYSLFNKDISNWNISVNCNRHNMFDNCPIKHKYMPELIRKYYDYE